MTDTGKGAVTFDMNVPVYEGKKAEPGQDGVKFSRHKVRFDLLPPLALIEVAKALTVGTDKYDKGVIDVQNWMSDNITHRDNFNAAQRHMMARRLGEVVDPDDNLFHVGKAIANLLMMLEADMRGWEAKDNFDPHCTKRPQQ